MRDGPPLLEVLPVRFRKSRPASLPPLNLCESAYLVPQKRPWDNFVCLQKAGCPSMGGFVALVFVLTGGLLFHGNARSTSPQPPHS